MAVDRCDVVAGLETGIGGGIGDRRSVGELNDGVDGADAGGVELGEGGFADEPDDTGEGEGEEDIERGAGDEDQHLRRVVDGWEGGDVGGAFALDGAEVGELREEDVAAERDPGEAVFDAVFPAARPDGGAETDGETLDLGAAFAGGEEMAEFVDEDRAAEKEDDEKRGPDVGEERSEEIHAEQEGREIRVADPRFSSARGGEIRCRQRGRKEDRRVQN